MANVFASVVNFNDVRIVKVNYPDGSVVPCDIWSRCHADVQQVLKGSSTKRVKLVMDQFYDWLSDAYEQACKDLYPVNGAFVISNHKTGEVRVYVANAGDAVGEQLMAGRIVEITDADTTERINSIAKEKSAQELLRYEAWQQLHDSSVEDNSSIEASLAMRKIDEIIAEQRVMEMFPDLDMSKDPDTGV